MKRNKNANKENLKCSQNPLSINKILASSGNLLTFILNFKYSNLLKDIAKLVLNYHL